MSCPFAPDTTLACSKAGDKMPVTVPHGPASTSVLQACFPPPLQAQLALDLPERSRAGAAHGCGTLVGTGAQTTSVASWDYALAAASHILQPKLDAFFSFLK